MPGSQTAPGRKGACKSAPVHIAFRQRNSVGAQNDVDFAAQWLAYAIPYRRFACILADVCARLGADVVCYSFIAVDFHHLLLTGLPAHSVLDPTLKFGFSTRPFCLGSFLTLLRPSAAGEKRTIGWMFGSLT